MSTYRVNVTRDEDGWLIGVDGLPNVHSWSPNLGRVRRYAAEAISVWLDQDITEEDLEVDVVVDGVSSAHCLMEARELAATADQASRKAVAVNKAVVERLADAGASVREIAPLVGLSPARVHQLLKA